MTKNQAQLDTFEELKILLQTDTPEEELWPVMRLASTFDHDFYLKKILPYVREHGAPGQDAGKELPMAAYVERVVRHIIQSSKAYESDTISSGLVYGWETTYGEFLQLGEFACDFLGIKDGAHGQGEPLRAGTRVVFGADITRAELNAAEDTLEKRCAARVQAYKRAAKAIGLGKPSFSLWCKGTLGGTELLKGVVWESEERVDSQAGMREFSSSEPDGYEKWTGPRYCGVPLGSADSQWDAIKAITLTNKVDRDTDKKLKKAGIEDAAYHLICTHTN